MDKLFLVDAYALIYRAYYGFIKNPLINSKGQNISAIVGFFNTLEDVLKHQNPTHIGVAFDPSGPTFRHEAYPEYKANREETPEAIRFAVPQIKKILEAYNIPLLEMQGYEADDIIGTLAVKAGERGIETYMLTPDKDYAQIVRPNVYMMRPQTGGEKNFEILDTEAVKAKYSISDPLQVIDFLALQGDSADNIPGCPGVGEKTASKIIQEFGSVENLLENTESLKGALKKKIEENREKITFSKFLATIKLDVPLELDMNSLKREPINEEMMRTLLTDLEMRSLLNKLLSSPSLEEVKVSAKPKKNRPEEPTLFDLFAEEDTKVEIQTNLSTLKDTGANYKLIDNDNDITKLVDYFLTFDFISFDTETTSVDPFNAELVGVSFSVKENEAFYIPISSDREKALSTLSCLRPVYENEAILKIGQNMKYDIEVLSQYDIEVKGKMFDTMIAHYCLQPELPHNMDYLAEIYLGYKTIHIDELIGQKGRNQKSMRDLDPKDVYEYAAEDADITLKLYNKLKAELSGRDEEKLFYEIEMPLVPVLAYMEGNGATIDTESLRETSETFSRRMTEIENEIYELAGTRFNIASPKQVGEILFDRLQISSKAKKTKTGQYTTSEEILQSLKSKHPIVEKILEHRGLKKLLGTYVDALPQLINPRTGKIHTSYNQAVTATGRLSSSNPNLQNIPIRDEDGKEIRKAFIPEEGCLFFSADYSQIELRIMAHLSGDENMVEAFRSGYDIHQATAAKVYKKDISEVTKQERSKAKTANFGIIYGISVWGLAERMMVDRKEAKELIDEYFVTYAKVRQYMDKSIEAARENGYIETIFKRRRYLPDITSHNSVVRGYAERNAINAPIQGSAADIIKVAMIRIYERFRRENIRSKMILQVHDELNFSVYPEEKDIVKKIVIEEMQGAISMKVPLIADSGWGANWLEAH